MRHGANRYDLIERIWPDRAPLEAAIRARKRIKRSQISEYLRRQRDPYLRALANAINPAVRAKVGRPNAAKRAEIRKMVAHARSLHDPFVNYALRLMRPNSKYTGGNAYIVPTYSEQRRQALALRLHAQISGALKAVVRDELRPAIRRGVTPNFSTLAKEYGLPQPAKVKNREVGDPEYDEASPEYELCLEEIYKRLRSVRRGTADESSGRADRYIAKKLGWNDYDNPNDKTGTSRLRRWRTLGTKAAKTSSQEKS